MARSILAGRAPARAMEATVTTRRGHVSLTFLTVLLWAGPGVAAEKTPIRFSLDFLVGGRHAGWFTALEKGFYDEAGLQVSWSRGYGGEDGMRRLLSGESDINFNDIPTTAILPRARQGAKIKAVAVIYAKHPGTIFFLKRSGIRTLKDLEGKTIADSPGSVTQTLFPAVARAGGADPTRVHWVIVPPDAKMQMLLAGKAQGLGIYVMQRPLLEKSAGDVDGFVYGDFIDLYSNGVLVTEAFLNRNPDAVKRFVKASIKGFLYAFEHPEEAAEYVLKHQPLLDRGVTRAEIAIVRDLAWSPEAKRHGLGYMDESKIRNSVELVSKVYDLKTRIAPEDVYTNRFLLEP